MELSEQKTTPEMDEIKAEKEKQAFLKSIEGYQKLNHHHEPCDVCLGRDNYVTQLESSLAEAREKAQWAEKLNDLLTEAREEIERLREACTNGMENTILLCEYAMPVYEKHGRSLTAIARVLDETVPCPTQPT